MRMCKVDANPWIKIFEHWEKKKKTEWPFLCAKIIFRSSGRFSKI